MNAATLTGCQEGGVPADDGVGTAASTSLKEGLEIIDVFTFSRCTVLRSLTLPNSIINAKSFI